MEPPGRACVLACERRLTGLSLFNLGPGVQGNGAGHPIGPGGISLLFLSPLDPWGAGRGGTRTVSATWVQGLVVPHGLKQNLAILGSCPRPCALCSAPAAGLAVTDGGFYSLGRENGPPWPASEFHLLVKDLFSLCPLYHGGHISKSVTLISESRSLFTMEILCRVHQVCTWIRTLRPCEQERATVGCLR